MPGDWRGTVWILLVTFCIVTLKCTETFWSPCISYHISISSDNSQSWRQALWASWCIPPGTVREYNRSRVESQETIISRIHWNTSRIFSVRFFAKFRLLCTYSCPLSLTLFLSLSSLFSSTASRVIRFDLEIWRTIREVAISPQRIKYRCDCYGTIKQENVLLDKALYSPLLAAETHCALGHWMKAECRTLYRFEIHGRELKISSLVSSVITVTTLLPEVLQLGY
jgi:hypothetical protein